MTYIDVNPHVCCNRPRPEDVQAVSRLPQHPHTVTNLTNNDRLHWKTNCWPSANPPPTTSPTKSHFINREHMERTQWVYNCGLVFVSARTKKSSHHDPVSTPITCPSTQLTHTPHAYRDKGCDSGTGKPRIQGRPTAT